MVKILIVDDSIVARMSVKGCIPKDLGYELAEAGDGSRAVEMFRSMRPDVTFLDLTMPDRHGLEILKELRNDFPESIIIILSADAQKQTKEKAEQLGAFSMIKKPPVKEVIQSELARALAVLEERHEDQIYTISPLEVDALQEIMNISFGQAAADLSNIVNMHVTLTVPHVNIIRINEIYPCIQNEISEKCDMSMIRQFFSGKFSGSSILIFPHGEGKRLLQLFSESLALSVSSGYDIDVIEKETLIEISNIIMGTCVSKIAGLLGEMVDYTPPCYYSQDQMQATLNKAAANSDAFAIFFKTVFHFEEFDASGFLFMISNYSTLKWLKKAIKNYLNQYV